MTTETNNSRTVTGERPVHNPIAMRVREALPEDTEVSTRTALRIVLAFDHAGATGSTDHIPIHIPAGSDHA